MQQQHGSGKTAVLVERIIRKIIEQKINIDQLLIVTFTNAAASQIREKILNAIYKKLEDTPNDEHLKKQTVLIHKANISTIHAFCLEIIRNNFFEMGISANFRIGDATEIEILKQEAIENVLIQTALSVDYPIQFYNTTEIIDTSKIINIMKENEVTSYKANEYKQYMIKYLQELMEDRNITVIRNYAIISYDGLFEDAQTELIRLYNFFKSNLLRAKIQTELLEEIDLYNLIFRELNKNSKVKLENIGGENLYVGKTKKNKETKK